MALDDHVPGSGLQRQHSRGQRTDLLHQLHPPNDHRRRLFSTKAHEQLLRPARRHRLRQEPLQPHHPSHPIHQRLHQRSPKQTRRGSSTALEKQQGRLQTIGPDARRHRQLLTTQSQMPHEHEPRLRLRLALARRIPGPRPRQSRMYVTLPFKPTPITFPSLLFPPTSLAS